MSWFHDKIEIAVGEARLLILGVQVLVGLEYNSVFESGFPALSQNSQWLKLGGLYLLLSCMILLLSPASYHQIVERGENSKTFLDYTTRMTEVALLPLALALGIDLYVAGEGILPPAARMAIGALGFLMALFFWYGWELLAAKSRDSSGRGADYRKELERKKSEMEKTSIEDKLKHVLMEERMVLPGVQALLGFQLIVFLLPDFKRLPLLTKYVHLISLWLIAVSIILLIAPAAYHRIVEHGEATEGFHRLASRIMLIAMAPLALAMCGDLFMVAQKVVSTAFALISSLTMLGFFLGLWFVFPLYARGKK